jgi:hypothetical protein
MKRLVLTYKTSRYYLLSGITICLHTRAKGSGQGPVAGSCEHRNEPQDSIK